MNNTQKDAIKELVASKKETYTWMSNMTFDDKGNICKTTDNIMLFLNEHPLFKGKLKYNDYLKRKEIDGEEFTDFDQNNIYVNVERCLGFDNHTKCDSAISEIFNTNKYNPVIDYLNSLIWDGETRIETIFSKLFEVEDTQLTREMSKKWFVAAVKRVIEPGCKFDNMIVLQGGQGIGKTTFCEKISKGFYSQISMDDLGNKDMVDKLNKTWVAIVDELEGFGKKDMQKIKSFLSVSNETVRLSYERNSRTFKRHCVFIGSTNDDTFLRDNTSSVERRFWIMKCNKRTMDTAVGDYLDKYNVDQLWAEAMNIYRNEDVYLDIDKTLFEEFEKQQQEFKTYNTDESTEWAYDILKRKYILANDGTFSDANDFFGQVNGDKTTVEELKNKINKIPASWLCQALNRFYNIKISQKTLALALSSEWTFGAIRYNSDVCKGFTRKNEVNQTISNYNNELPF